MHGDETHTDLAHYWNELATAALVGTAKQLPRRPPAGDPPGDLLAQLDPGEPEQMLLSAAAALSLYQQAGQPPAASPADPPLACPPDDTPACSGRAGQYLTLMLDNGYRAVLPEWLAMVAKAGQRVPEAYLVALLDHGARHKDVREAIIAVIGQRGRWLATLNPAWEYASRATEVVAGEGDSSDAIEQQWQTSPQATRQTLFKELRQRDPARARHLLADTWKTEKLDDRRHFLGEFASGLSMDDEPFLEEHALSDRSKEIRALAADLLGQLPDSRLSQRMCQRANGLLSYRKGGLFKKSTILVTLPDGDMSDPALQRDGLTSSKPAWFKAGKDAWGLYQLVSFVPPAHWCEQWGIGPDALVQAADNSKWAQVLLLALGTAARRLRDLPCIDAVLTALLDQDEQQQLHELIGMLPPDKREQHYRVLLHDNPLLATDLLQHHDAMWSHALTHDLLRLMEKNMTTAKLSKEERTVFYQLRSNLPVFALRMPPDLAPDLAATNWEAKAHNWPSWKNQIEEMVALLHFRYEMLKEFEGA